MAAKRNFLVELFWRVHPNLYRWSAGRIGGSMMGLPVLLLTTKGRKTGQSRTNALMYLPRGKNCVVIASYLGEPRHPFWWLNLEAEPDATIQVGGTRHAVRAREARTRSARALARRDGQGRRLRRIPGANLSSNSRRGARAALAF